jgi:hypothetical protein
MRLVLALLFTGAAALQGADPAREKAVTEVVNRFFRAMTEHDGAALNALLTSDGRYSAVSENGTVTGGTHADFITRIASSKDALLERTWNPKVLLDGRVAVLWAPYDFHHDGRFSHCGVDSFSLVETSGGWKIAGIVYSVQRSNCPDSPLGAPTK